MAVSTHFFSPVTCARHFRMSNPSVKAFVELIQRSALVEPKSLKRTLLDCKQHYGGQLPRNAEVVAQWLIQAGLLTSWQRDRLFERRHRGFFMGQYKLLEHLATGGMCNVYVAEHTVLRVKRAMKVLPHTRAGDSSYLARFEQEARSLAAMEHPNIVRAFDLDRDGDRHYLIMELVQGHDISLLVAKHGPLPSALAANLITQAAEGLEYAHQQGLVHRDVKPANLLLNNRGVVKILDLGLALVANDEAASLTLRHNENVIGTADYLAPEQALNSHGVDARADIYGLGCTLYFALTGHPPFPEGTIPQRIAKHQHEAPPSILIDRPDCPADLNEICMRMMRKKPEERYASCRDVANTLERWLQHHGVLSGLNKLETEEKVELLANAAAEQAAAWTSTDYRSESGFASDRATDRSTLPLSNNQFADPPGGTAPTGIKQRTGDSDSSPPAATSGSSRNGSAPPAATISDLELEAIPVGNGSSPENAEAGTSSILDAEPLPPLPPPKIERHTPSSHVAEHLPSTPILIQTPRSGVRRYRRKRPCSPLRVSLWLAVASVVVLGLAAGIWAALR